MTDTGTKQGEDGYGERGNQWVPLLCFCCKYFPHMHRIENLNNCSQNAYVLNIGWFIRSCGGKGSEV